MTSELGKHYVYLTVYSSYFLIRIEYPEENLKKKVAQKSEHFTLFSLFAFATDFVVKLKTNKQKIHIFMF